MSDLRFRQLGRRPVPAGVVDVAAELADVRGGAERFDVMIEAKGDRADVVLAYRDLLLADAATVWIDGEDVVDVTQGITVDDPPPPTPLGTGPDFVVSCVIEYGQAYLWALGMIASLKARGFVVESLIAADCTRAAWWIALHSRPRALIHCGHGIEGGEGLLMHDGVIPPGWWWDYPPDLRDSVLYLNSCQVAIGPGFPAMMGAKPRVLAATTPNLYLPSGLETAICFWDKVLDGAPMAPAQQACAKALYWPQGLPGGPKNAQELYGSGVDEVFWTEPEPAPEPMPKPPPAPEPEPKPAPKPEPKPKPVHAPEPEPAPAPAPPSTSPAAAFAVAGLAGLALVGAIWLARRA